MSAAQPTLAAAQQSKERGLGVSVRKGSIASNAKRVMLEPLVIRCGAHGDRLEDLTVARFSAPSCAEELFSASRNSGTPSPGGGQASRNMAGGAQRPRSGDAFFWLNRVSADKLLAGKEFELACPMGLPLPFRAEERPLPAVLLYPIER